MVLKYPKGSFVPSSFIMAAEQLLFARHFSNTGACIFETSWLDYLTKKIIFHDPAWYVSDFRVWGKVALTIMLAPQRGSRTDYWQTRGSNDGKAPFLTRWLSALLCPANRRAIACVLHSGRCWSLGPTDGRIPPCTLSFFLFPGVVSKTDFDRTQAPLLLPATRLRDAHSSVIIPWPAMQEISSHVALKTRLKLNFR